MVRMKKLCLVNEVYNSKKGSRMLITIPFEDILDKKLKEFTDWSENFSKALNIISKGSYSKLYIKYIDENKINKTYYVRKGDESRFVGVM